MTIDTTLSCSIVAASSSASNNAKSPQLGNKRKIMSLSHQNSVNLTTTTNTTTTASDPSGTTSASSASSASSDHSSAVAVKAENTQADAVRPSSAPALPPMGLRRHPSGSVSTAAGAGASAGSLQRSNAQSLSSATSNSKSSGSLSAKANASAKNNTKTKTVAFSASSCNLAAGSNSDSSEPIQSTYSCDGAADLSAEGIFGNSGGAASVPVCLNVGTPVAQVAAYMPIESEIIIVDKDDLNPLKVTFSFLYCDLLVSVVITRQAIVCS